MLHEDTVYLITSDVSKRTGLTPATIRLYEKMGRLRAIRTVGGVRLFSNTDVEEFMADRAERARTREVSR